jgi:hypothetical protein
MASSVAATINMEETRTTSPAAGSAKWAQVRGYLSRAEQGHLSDNDIGPERAWRMCRSYRKSQAEAPSG